MKKFILALLLVNSFLYAQTSLDIIKEINKNTYKSMQEQDLKSDEFKKEVEESMKTMEKEVMDGIESMKTEFKEFGSNYMTEAKTNKQIVDLQVENQFLKNKIADLEYGLNNKEKQITDKDQEILNLKIRYNALSKAIYFLTKYKCTSYELADYFTDEEFKIINELPKEWKRKYLIK